MKHLNLAFIAGFLFVFSTASAFAVGLGVGSSTQTNTDVGAALGGVNTNAGIDAEAGVRAGADAQEEDKADTPVSDNEGNAYSRNDRARAINKAQHKAAQPYTDVDNKSDSEKARELDTQLKLYGNYNR